MKSANSVPNPVDVHVGKRLRLRRKVLGHSQSAVAKALGITFQQIQKYERGANRISASKLYEASQFLGVSVPYFYDGIDDENEPSDPNMTVGQGAAQSLLMTYEGVELAENFPRIRTDNHRQKVLGLISALAAGDE